MTAVARLLTLVELTADGADAHRMSLSARLEAVLPDGRRLRLLDNRGWTSQLNRVRVDGARDDDPSDEDAPASWTVASIEDIERTARQVVGPDEPFGRRSQADMETEHWASLAHALGLLGVVVNAKALERLPHDVVLGERLVARLSRHAGGARRPSA
jgi:hypothetical protein